MGSMSVWHWTILLFVSLVWVIPFWRIVAKAGYPGALALLGLILGVNLILLWIFAFVRWPVESRRA